MTTVTPIRIMMTGVGGQGTLTATTLLSRAVVDKGLPVTSGEIHGMAQRGGVVESTVLIGCHSPKLAHGEADVLLGFEPMETLRAMPYLKPGGLVLSSSEFLPPLSVATGKQECPAIEEIEKTVRACAGEAVFMPCQSIGEQAGAVQSGNIALLGAFAAAGIIPVTPEDLIAAVKKYMNPKIVDVNLKALQLGVDALAEARGR